MVVRLIAPAGPAPTPPQTHASARAIPRAHDDILAPKRDAHAAPTRAAPAPDASSARPSLTPPPPAVLEPKRAKSAAVAPRAKARELPRPPKPLGDQPPPAAVKGDTGGTPRDAQLAEPAPVAPSPAETKSTASAGQNPQPPAAEQTAASLLARQSPGASSLITEARFDAAYLSNPAPSYPRNSRRRGEEGRVLLRVRVLADGAAGVVEIAEGSGHPRLDDAARDAVRNWRFVPASRGDTKIDSWLNVPIVFRLED